MDFTLIGMSIIALVRIIHIPEFIQASIFIDMRVFKELILRKVSQHTILFPVIIFVYDLKVRIKACVYVPEDIPCGRPSTVYGHLVESSGFRVPTVVKGFGIRISNVCGENMCE